MTELELDRRIREWLIARDPGPVPTRLTEAAALVPIEFGVPIGWRVVDTIAARLAIPQHAIIRTIRIAVLLTLLLLGLIAATVLIGSSPPDPNDLVRLSQAAHADPPAFTMSTTVYDVPGDNATFHGCDSIWLDEETVQLMRLDYVYDGEDHFRIDCRYVGSTPGRPTKLDDAYVVIGPDGEGGVWTGDTWVAGRHLELRPAGAAPVATVEWLNWLVYPPDARSYPSTPGECDWALWSQDVVAGRPAWSVTCGMDRIWIDAESHLIVKRERDGIVISEAIAMEVGQAPPSELFGVAPPSVRRERLVDGSVPVAWTLPRPDGGSVDWSALRGKPAVVLTRTDNCPDPCLSLATFVQTMGPLRGQVNAVGYASWTASDVRLSDPDEIAAAVGFSDDELRLASLAGIPVVADDGQVTPGWDVWHGVELFDADGRHIATTDPRSATSLAAEIDALLAGDPIPERPPGDGVFVVGAPPPTLVARRLDGGTFELSDLEGTATAILSPGWLDDATAAEVTALTVSFTAACEAAGPRLACIVLPSAGPDGADPLDGWADLWARIATDGAVDQVTIAAFPEDDRWASLLTPYVREPGGQRAIVAISAAGDIMRVSGDPVADPDAMREIIDPR